MRLINQTQQQSRAFSVGPQHVRPSNHVVNDSMCASKATMQCQERIQCLEKALGFMQFELNRLQSQHVYKSTECLESHHGEVRMVGNKSCPDFKPETQTSYLGQRILRRQQNSNKKIQYERIQVWPSSPSVLLEDFGCKRSDFGGSRQSINTCSNNNKQLNQTTTKWGGGPPKPLPRSVSMRARSVAPSKYAKQSFFSDAFRATSAPPEPPKHLLAFPR